MKRLFLRKQDGVSQLVIMVIMVVLAVSLPIATKLVQKNQENRSQAALAPPTGTYGSKCTKDSQCNQKDCWKDVCTKQGSDEACKSIGGSCNASMNTKTGSKCTTAGGLAGEVIANLCLSKASINDYRCCIPTCTPGATKCDGAYISTCPASGFGWSKAANPCPNGCTGGDCNECSIGSNKCESSVPYTCPAGKWVAGKKCDYGCNGTVCKTKAPCTSNPTCSGNKIINLCDSNGNPAEQDCTGSTPICAGAAGAAKCVACTPNTYGSCGSDTHQIKYCNSSGVWEDKVVCTGNQKCVNDSKGKGSCVGVCTNGQQLCDSSINTKYKVCTQGDDGGWGWSTTDNSCDPDKVCDLTTVGTNVCHYRDFGTLKFTLRYALAGVKPNNDKCIDDSWELIIKVGRKKDNSTDAAEESETDTYKLVKCSNSATNSKGEIVYCANIELGAGNLTSLNGISIYLSESTKHIMTKYGVNNQNTVWIDSTNGVNGKFNLEAANQIFDLSEFPILGGDVTNEDEAGTTTPDGKITSQDWAYISNLSKPITVASVWGKDLYGDIDGNCVINSGDADLVRLSLSKAAAQTY